MSSSLIFDMVDHPDSQDELLTAQKPNVVFHNEMIALIVLGSLFAIGIVAYLIARSMIYIKKEKAQERLPINNFGQIHLP
ncbi:unnamed protein product [Caenorhabditis angaria]|uniref:Uncharacterized protein n=1 Tax=Caenorhabditis angaria TaxID=860376 RepID=A0A9P1IZU3_9PELO|nr:unnamed protein product [Caenorhabditis angaria]